MKKAVVVKEAAIDVLQGKLRLEEDLPGGGESGHSRPSLPP